MEAPHYYSNVVWQMPFLILLPFYFLLFIKRSEYQNKLHTTGKCAGSTESISIFWGQIYTICCFGCATRKIKWITLQNSNSFQQ